MDILKQALDAVSETARVEFKEKFDPSSLKDWVEIIKDIVAMANSGGGVILFGVDNNGAPVVDFDAEIIQRIDPAHITDKIRKYTGYHFGGLKVLKTRKGSKELVALVIDGVETPIVFSSPGTYPVDNRRQKTAFSQGTIYFRHGAKSEPATREDLHQCLQRARQAAREELLERIKTVATLPEDATIQIITGINEPIDTPDQLLANAVRRRERDSSHLLTAKELLWVFHQREQMRVTKAEMHLLIGSSLRRTPTLYWWLQLMERKYDEDIALSEAWNVLEARDRDKSDAGRTVVEVASIYANDKLLEKIISALRQSRYSHFQQAADKFVSREVVLRKLFGRIKRAKYKDTYLLELTLSNLEHLASEVALRMIKQPKPSSADSKRLGDITRVIWYMSSPHSKKVFPFHT